MRRFKRILKWTLGVVGAVVVFAIAAAAIDPEPTPQERFAEGIQQMQENKCDNPMIIRRKVGAEDWELTCPGCSAKPAPAELISLYNKAWPEQTDFKLAIVPAVWDQAGACMVVGDLSVPKG